jgi:hypothetical protein
MFPEIGEKKFVFKGDSPFGLFSLLAAMALLTWLAWFAWRPPVRVTRPTLDVGSETIVASTQLTNRSSTPRAVTIRFDFGYQVIAFNDSAASSFQLIASRDVAADVKARTTQTVRCEFPHPHKPLPFLADAQIVSQR